MPVLVLCVFHPGLAPSQIQAQIPQPQVHRNHPSAAIVEHAGSVLCWAVNVVCRPWRSPPGYLGQKKKQQRPVGGSQYLKFRHAFLAFLASGTLGKTSLDSLDFPERAKASAFKREEAGMAR